MAVRACSCHKLLVARPLPRSVLGAAFRNSAAQGFDPVELTGTPTVLSLYAQSQTHIKLHTPAVHLEPLPMTPGYGFALRSNNNKESLSSGSV
jgi:hypothetical protein